MLKSEAQVLAFGIFGKCFTFGFADALYENSFLSFLNKEYITT